AERRIAPRDACRAPCSWSARSRVLRYNPRPEIPGQLTGDDVDQAQLDLQLKVWKDLAISKQILMRTAASALKLDPDCSQEELKEALEKTIKRGEQADAEVLAAREQAKQA